ncbi:hypothetical protein GCM10011504_51350 [Siccirubricoccus deserti]|nr:hypothetical protein GCM10011504_51350 [Siccirubricoccus deserti]
MRAGYEVVGVFRETGSGAWTDGVERRKVLALAQRREIDAVLVTELSRWGRGTLDLLHTLQELEARRVSVIAMSGLAFDLSTPHGRMLATVIVGIAAFERELIRERVRSGMAAAKARGKKLGRQPGQRPKSDHLAPKILALVAQGRSNQASPANSACSAGPLLLSLPMAWSPPARQRRSWLVEQAGDYATPISYHTRDGTWVLRRPVRRPGPPSSWPTGSQSSCTGAWAPASVPSSPHSRSCARTRASATYNAAER